MSAPDFYFAVNATFRYLHDRCGKDALIDYWRRLEREYDADRAAGRCRSCRCAPAQGSTITARARAGR